MKKSIIALILAALMLFCCGCSDSDDNSTAGGSFGGMFEDNSGTIDYDDEDEEEDDNDDNVVIIDDNDEDEDELSFLPELPDGWVTHREDNIYLSYPADEFDVITGYGADFQIIDDEGSNINIICHDTSDFDMDDISDSYIESILDYAIDPLDSVYEEALGTECDTTGSSGGYKMMTFGNEECACLYYTVNIYAAEYDTTIVLDYFQVLYASEDNYYTITFTYSPSISIMTAEEFFADIIHYLYVA